MLANDCGSSTFKRKLHDGAKPFSDLLGANLLDWLLEERGEGRVVTNAVLQKKARQLAAAMPNNENFSASSGI